MTDFDPISSLILFEDNHLLAVNKPSGLLTQPSGTQEKSIEGELKIFLKKRDHKPGNVFLEAIHRLDRPVQGIVLFAKSRKALTRLQEAQRARKIRKFYEAQVTGTPPREGMLLVHHLRKEEFSTRVVSESTPEAKRAELYVVSVRDNKVLVELKTGRYHQIRAQLAAVGCPICGDTKYGAVRGSSVAIALNHVRMEFTHPVGGKEIVLEQLP